MSTANSDPTDPPEHFAPRIDVRKGIVAMAISLGCFTTNSLLLKHMANHHIDPWVSMTFRFGIGLVLTSVFLSPQLIRCFKSWLMASRGVLGGLGTAAYYSTVGPLGAGKATLIGNTWCVFAALMAVVVLRERLSASKVMGIVIALLGVALLMEIQSSSFGHDWQWEMVSLTGALLAAAVVVVIRQLTKTESSATIFASQCVYGLLLAVPFALMKDIHLGVADVGFLTVAAICASAGQIAMTEGFRFLTVAAGGAFQIVLPLVISLGGVVFFDEHFTTIKIAGAALILVGSFVTVRR